MVKKYKCRLSASSLLVNVKGNVFRIEFEPDVISQYGMRGCSYSTDKAAVQRAIERSKRFNSHQRDEIWTDDVEPKEQEVNLTELPAEEVHPVVEKKVTRVRRTKKEV